MMDETKSPEELRRQVADLKQEIAGCRSDNQRLESALKESELRYKALLYNLPEKVFWKDSASAYVSCNHNYAKDFGMTPEQIVGKTDYDLYPPGMAEKYRADDRRIMDSGGTEEIEETYGTPAGKTFVVRTVKTALKDEHGNVTGILGIFSDIAARKEAEETLRDREARLIETQEVASLGFYVLDITAGRWTSSSVLDRILGIPADYARTVDGWAGLLHPDDRQQMVDYLLKEVVGEKKPFDHEHRIVRYGDKQVRWVHGLGRLEFNADGQPVSMIGTIQDITERKQSERELAKHRAMLQATVDCLPFNFFALGLDGRYMLQNAVSKAQHRTDVVGKRPEEVCPNEHDLAIWTENNRRALAGEKVEGEVTLSLTGEERFYHNIIAPISDGTELYGILGVNIDITERKRAEEALQRAHDGLERRVRQRTAELTKANENLAVFRKFAESSGEGFGMSDFDGRIVYVNPTLCRLFGEEKPEDVMGKTVSTYYLPEYVQRRQDEMIPTLLREGYWHAEHTVLPRHGKPIQTLQSTFLIRDESGNPFRIAVVISDITERKRAEEALQESEEKYRTLVETTGTGYVILDERGRVLDANAEYVRLAGHRSLSEIMGRRVEEWTAPHDAERNTQEVQKCLETRTVRQLEVDHLGSDGKLFPVEISASVIETKQGKQIISLCRDITERRQAEEALRASEERFRVTFEEAPVGMAICVDDGVIAKANRALSRMSGYTQEELIGTHARDLTHPEDRELSGPSVKKLLGGEIPSFTLEKRYLRKDGEPFWAQATTAAVQGPDGKVAFALGIVEDITERKRAEEALRQSERRFRNYFEQGLIGMAVTSVDKRWLEVNDRLCEILGYRREELTETNWAALTHPDDVESNLRFFNPLLAGEIDHFTLNKRYLKKDGSIVHATIHTRAFRKENRTIDHIVTLIEDITERKRAEEALEQERQTLWHMLQASDHERQTISYDIHDGLAQYLAAAAMQLQVFDGFRDSNPEEAKEAYDAATQLVRQSHAEARRLVSEVRPPVIDEIGLETAISHLVYEQRRRGGTEIECRSSVQFGRLPPILENAIYRMVQEALTNACKHSKSKKVTVTMTQQGQDVRLEVRDWGIGFDPESVGKGHFGLEGIRQRVRLLGGRLTIESAPGSGTLVQVVVPVVERQNEE